MIFLTVGTLFPFDRLVRAVDSAVVEGALHTKLYAQVGKNGYQPQNFESVENLDKLTYDNLFIKADAIIAHAGMGTITMALDLKKPIMVMPRLKRYKEHVNDHQLSAAVKYDQLGHVIAVYDAGQIAQKFHLLQNFIPVPRVNQVDKVSDRIAQYLMQLAEECK